MSPRPFILALAVTAAASAARAGETACWFEGGVVVAPAEVMGVAGDYIVDTGTPNTLLAETQAQGAGFAETELIGPVRLAGVTLPDRPVSVADIDVRTGLFPTPIAGVIGYDVLRAYVVDLSFAPCRLRLSAPDRAPAFGPGARLPLQISGGLPTVPASVSDGGRTLSGAFVLATGADAAVRLSDALAAAPGAPKPQELYTNGVLRARLRALSVGGRLYENVLAGLEKPQDPALTGRLGAALFAGARLRIDMPHGQARIGRNEKGPGEAPRP